MAGSSVKAQHRHERLLRDLHVADALHPSLAHLLLPQKLALARDVAAVALGDDVLAEGGDTLAGNDLAPDRGLDGDLEHLPWDEGLELLRQPPPLLGGVLAGHDHRERIDPGAPNEDVELDQVGGAVTAELVVERGITLGARLQDVVEIMNQLRHRQVVVKQHPVAGLVLEVDELPPAVPAKLHHRAGVFRWTYQRDLGSWLFNGGGMVRRREALRVVDHLLAPIGIGHLVDDGWRGGDQLKATLALQALL